VLDVSNREAEAGPVVAHLQYFQHVALDGDVAIEVLLMERLERDLALAIVALAVLLFVEAEVVFNGLLGQHDFVVLAGRVLGREDPEGSEEGQVHDQGEEDPCLEAASEGPGDVARHADQDGEEQRVRKVLGAGAVGRERGIVNGRVLLWA